MRAQLQAGKSWSKFSSDGDGIDYEAMEALLAPASAAGESRGRSQGPSLTDLHHGAAPTVPTTRGGDPRHAAPMRLDYALATPALLRLCPGVEARPITDEAAGLASDHYPLLVELCAELTGEGASAASRASAASLAATSAASSSASASSSTSIAAPTASATTSTSTTASGECGARQDYSARFAPSTRQRCAALSGMRSGVLGARGGGGEGGGEGAGATLGRCAVVGSSGLLKVSPQGGVIDGFDTVVRLNAAPTRGYEQMAGSRTDVRLVNIPQSEAWGRRLKGGRGAPEEVSSREVLLLMGSTSPWKKLLAHHAAAAGVAKINKTFRSECVSPFFSDAERAAHKATHRNTLTPTFGFEAVVHALYACASVDAFGFFLDPRLDEPAPACVAPPCPLEHYQPRQDIVPYHYWEASTVDQSAPDPARPWTFASHDFALEARRLRHMAADGCLLTLHRQHVGT